MKIDLRGVLSDLGQTRTLWKSLRAAREAGLVLNVVVGVPAADDSDPWADVMPSRPARGDTWVIPRPVLAPQFHPVTDAHAAAVDRGGFDPNADPYSEAEWRAAAAPLTPIEGN